MGYFKMNIPIHTHPHSPTMAKEWEDNHEKYKFSCGTVTTKKSSIQWGVFDKKTRSFMCKFEESPSICDDSGKVVVDLCFMMGVKRKEKITEDDTVPGKNSWNAWMLPTTIQFTGIGMGTKDDPYVYTIISGSILPYSEVKNRFPNLSSPGFKKKGREPIPSDTAIKNLETVVKQGSTVEGVKVTLMELLTDIEKKLRDGNTMGADLEEALTKIIVALPSDFIIKALQQKGWGVNVEEA